MRYLLHTDHDIPNFGTKSLVNSAGIALLLDKAFPERDDFLPLQVAWPIVYYAFRPLATENTEGSSSIHNRPPGFYVFDDAAETGREELRETLEHHGISLDSSDSQGKGVLHLLSNLLATNLEYQGEENLKYLQFLLGRGVPIDLRDHKGRTLLHFAAKGGDEDTIRHLMKAGADPLASDHSGLTALHYTIQSNSLDVVKPLLENDADVDTTTKQGDSVLHFSA